MNAWFAKLSSGWRALPPVPRLIIGTLVVLLLLSALRPGAPRAPETSHAPRVAVEPVHPATFSPQLSLFGRVESPASATLSSSVMADVQELLVLPGYRVKAGEIILRLNPKEAELTRAQAQAALNQTRAQLAAARARHQSDLKSLALENSLTELAQQNVGRLEQLRERQLASQIQLDDARQQLARQQLSLEARQLAVNNHPHDIRQLEGEIARTQAILEQAELDLSRSTVSAPFDGRVTSLHVAAGERVRPGEPLVSLYAERGVEIRAQIPANALPQVRAGLAQGNLTGELVIESQRLPLSLARLAGEVSAGRGGVDALFTLDAPDFTPELGRPLPLRLNLAPLDNLVALPGAALHGMDRVYRVNSKNELETNPGQRIGEWLSPHNRTLLLFRGDFQEGDQIMVNQLPGAIDGLRVVPVLNPQAPDTATSTPTATSDHELEAPSHTPAANDDATDRG